MVHQQLNALATGIYAMQGMPWANQRIEWEIVDEDGQHEAGTHLPGRDEPGLPARTPDGAHVTHGAERTLQATVELAQVLRRFVGSGHGDGEDICFEVPGRSVGDVQTHAVSISFVASAPARAGAVEGWARG